MNELILRGSVLLAAVVQIVFPYFVNPFRDGARPVQNSVPSQIEPAGYAFAIWGPIYLAAVVYAVWQLTPAGRSDAVTARIAPLAVILYAGSSLWLTGAEFGPLWATMPILAVMGLCAVAALKLATDIQQPSLQQKLCLILPFGLYAGWTICATFVNIAEVAPGYGFNRFGLSIRGYAVLSLGILTLVVALVSWLTRGNPVFAATVIWALVAIIVAAPARQASPLIPIAAGAAIAAVLVLTFAFRSWSRAR
jgi:hypothetical protein